MNKKYFINKQILCNTIEDFIEAGEYLEKLGYTWNSGEITGAVHIYTLTPSDLLVISTCEYTLAYYSCTLDRSKHIELNWSTIKQRIRSEKLNKILSE